MRTVDAVIVRGRSGDDGLSAIGEAWGELSDGKAGEACADVYLPGVGDDGLEAILRVSIKSRRESGGNTVL
jgi:hypothetical protein